jgi:hypothetical protein
VEDTIGRSSAQTYLSSKHEGWKRGESQRIVEDMVCQIRPRTTARLSLACRSVITGGPGGILFGKLTSALVHACINHV